MLNSKIGFGIPRMLMKQDNPEGGNEDERNNFSLEENVTGPKKRKRLASEKCRCGQVDGKQLCCSATLAPPRIS